MQSLRIALALLGLVVVWFVVLPARPTLLNPAPAVQEASVGDETPAPDDDTAVVPAGTVRPEPNVPIRSIIPSPLTQGGDLKRMPPAASGAATPITAEPAQGDPAAADAGSPAAPAEDDPAEAGAPAPGDAEVAAAAPPAGPSFKLFNRPIAIDSGTVRAGETTLRMAGVEPIAPEARCASGTQSWPCGVRARTAFRAWLRGRSLLCTVPPGTKEGDEMTVPCLMGEEDVGAWLVTNGWAAAAKGSRYEPAETEARNARRGIWAFQIEG